MNNNIKGADFTRALPVVISENKDIKALSVLIQEELRKTTNLIDKNKIFCAISELDEGTLDILAYDLNVLWYDFNYSVEIKREVIKDCIKIYRKLGTPYAVKRALGNVFPDSTLKEWYETSGEPFTFEVEINASKSGATKELQEMALDRIRYYKNLRSHLKKITYNLEDKFKVKVGAALTTAQNLIIFPYTAENIEERGKTKIAIGQVFKLKLSIYPA